MNNEELVVVQASSQVERARRAGFLDEFRDCPLPDDEILSNLGLFLKRQDLSRVLLIAELYKKIVNVHGSLLEFGVRWGQNLALWTSLRGIYEPYNYNRKIVGFDTFSGFTEPNERDGDNDAARAGSYGVTSGYEEYLDRILAYHESESPISHIKKYELVVGDASLTLPEYLERCPETIVALAYFDFDLYEPTYNCLQLISDRLVKGSVVAFDELNCQYFPGETIAVQEALGLRNCRLQRLNYGVHQAFMVVE